MRPPNEIKLLVAIEYQNALFTFSTSNCTKSSSILPSTSSLAIVDEPLVPATLQNPKHSFQSGLGLIGLADILMRNTLILKNMTLAGYRDQRHAR